jgi:hypothetical protein
MGKKKYLSKTEFLTAKEILIALATYNLKILMTKSTAHFQDQCQVGRGVICNM